MDRLNAASTGGLKKGRGDQAPRFPGRLHYALTELAGDCDEIICWQKDGKGFRILDKVRLEKELLPL